MLQQLLDILYAPLCVVCGEKEDLKYASLCNNCYNSIHFLETYSSVPVQKGFEKLWVLAAYEGPWLEIIHKFKYENSAPSFKVIKNILGEKTPSYSEIDSLVPVPLDFFRYFRRNYNQAELVSRFLSKKLRKKHLKRAIVKKRRPRQVGLHSEERKINLSNAYEVPRLFPSNVSGRHILLVDDVTTTGSTISECAKALKRAGAKRVDVLTLAKTL